VTQTKQTHIKVGKCELINFISIKHAKRIVS